MVCVAAFYAVGVRFNFDGEPLISLLRGMAAADGTFAANDWFLSTTDYYPWHSGLVALLYRSCGSEMNFLRALHLLYVLLHFVLAMS